MCRLYGFRANEPTKVECTLVHAQNALLLQSRADMLGRSHSDGWGIAYYHEEHPEVQRRATPAFEDLYFSETAERIFTQTVVAHVRQATVGAPALVNCHPFSHGVWAFAHNGTVRGFDHLRDEIIAETHADLRNCRQGTTDSEHAFYWLLSRMAEAGIALTACCRDVAALGDVLAAAVDELAKRCRMAEPDVPAKLNFLLTDGRALAASRWNNSLYWVERHGVHDCEICGIPHVHHETGTAYRAAVIASEPITHEDWREVPDHSVLLVDESIDASLRRIAAPRDNATSTSRG
jgi:glutamine amidotransferase